MRRQLVRKVARIDQPARAVVVKVARVIAGQTADALVSRCFTRCAAIRRRRAAHLKMRRAQERTGNAP